jgi:probable phosphoglycerate mutase
MDATVCPWLEEFPVLIDRPDMTDGKKHGIWDWLPADWTAIDEFYDKDKWADVPIFKEAGVREVYEQVIAGLDKLLAEHGYERDGRYYRVTKPNSDTIAFFCHFGLECVLLSHLLSISPMILWHGSCAAPTSVTTIYTEERRRGIASFRICGMGDTSHLYMGNEPVAFAGRWCETYDTPGQRR